MVRLTEGDVLRLAILFWDMAPEAIVVNTAFAAIWIRTGCRPSPRHAR